MISKVCAARLRGRRLEPCGWTVRRSFSPFWSGWGGRWWALLLCDEGLVAFEWPRRKYWARQFLLGLTAGAGQQPSVDGDSWPLKQLQFPVEGRSALMYPRECIAGIRIKRRRIFPHELHVIDATQRSWVYTMADRRKVDDYAAVFLKNFPEAK